MANGGTLSTKKLEASRGSGGLSPSLLPAGGGLDRLSLALGQVNPNAANVEFTPAQIPATVKDQVTPALNEFAGRVVSSVWDYQERESEYLANKAYLQYEQALRNKFYGTQDSEGNHIPGYSSTSGDTAVTGYAGFEKFSQEAFSEITSTLEPRVKAKALLKLQSAKGTYLGKASTHRAQGLQQVQESQRYAKQQVLMYDLAANPESYNVPDPVTGQTLKSKFYSSFSTLEDADSAWRNALVDVAKLKYLNTYRQTLSSGARESTALKQARAASQQFVNQVAAPELANAPKHMGVLLADLKRYEEEARAAYVSEETLAIKQAERREKEIQEHNEALLEADIIRGNIPSSSYVSDLVVNGSISPEYGRNIKSEYYNDTIKAPDPIQMQELTDQIRENAQRNFKIQYDSAGNIIKESLKGFYNKVPGVFSEARTILRNYEESLNDPDYRDREKRGSELIKIWTEGMPWHKLQAEELGTIRWKATEELKTRLLNGEDYTTVMKDLFTKYNSSINNLKLRSSLPDGHQPQTGSQLRDAISYYKNRRDSYTEEEWERIQAQLNGYAKDIEEILKRQNQSKELFGK